MATVTGFTAERMLEIENTTIVSGLVDVNGDLILYTREGTPIEAGHVKGSDGEPGEDGAPGIDGETGIPAGSILAWAASAIPDNWLECNGQAVSRTTYSDLFAIIGVQYGAGNGSTTFNVPDLRGRVPVGLDSSDGDFDSLGESGGVKAVTLTGAQSGMPAHEHGSRGHSYANDAGFASGRPQLLIATTNNFPAGTTLPAGPVNASEAHTNLQPYRVTKYIIKASGGIDTLSSTVESVLLDRVAAVEAWTGINRPAFVAAGTGTLSKSGSQTTTKMPFTVEKLDRQGNYDAPNSRFIAPVSGLYEFTVMTAVTSSVAGPELFFYKNGSDLYGYIAIGYGAAYNTFGNTLPVELSEDDYLEVYIRNNNSTSFTMDLTRSIFSGKYLG